MPAEPISLSTPATVLHPSPLLRNSSLLQRMLTKHESCSCKSLNDKTVLQRSWRIHNRALVDCAELVVVEVNENIPRCVGGLETQVSINQVDYIVEGDKPSHRRPSRERRQSRHGCRKLVVPEIPNDLYPIRNRRNA